jgi:hypothetical protein
LWRLTRNKVDFELKKRTIWDRRMPVDKFVMCWWLDWSLQ